MMTGVSRDGLALLTFRVPIKMEKSRIVLKKMQCIVRPLFLLTIGIGRLFKEILSMKVGFSLSAKNFEIDVEDGASLRSRRERSRWSCTLECAEINIDKKDSGKIVHKSLQILNSQIQVLQNFSEWFVIRTCGRFRDTQEKKHYVLLPLMGHV